VHTPLSTSQSLIDLSALPVIMVDENPINVQELIVSICPFKVSSTLKGLIYKTLMFFSKLAAIRMSLSFEKVRQFTDFVKHLVAPSSLPLITSHMRT
jgi:hypothetical protein